MEGIYTERTTCRICNGGFKDIISLGDIYLSTFVDTNDVNVPKVPIDLVQCTKCGLAQLRHTVNPDVMYHHDYWYQSGLNQSMVKALHDIYKQSYRRCKFEQDDIVVDIGANDGTLLKHYAGLKRPSVKRVAFEPSNLAHLAEDHCDVLINDFFSADAYFAHMDKQAKLITSIAMFYDLEDPHNFVNDICKVLAPNGIWIIQMMDLKSMVKQNDFPNLCHEHLEYYSLNTLAALLESHNLDIYDLEYNNVNGGSLRVYVVHKGFRKPQHYVGAFKSHDRYFFDAIDLSTYFKENIEYVRSAVVDFINEANRNGEVVAVLGASTKGNTTLQYFGLTDADIHHAAEINPDKFGKYTVGSDIPIISQEESLALNPSYYLVLPWGFIDFFIMKFNKYLTNGGSFIVPLPNPRIISFEDNKLCTIDL